jgi:hypothetical protein
MIGLHDRITIITDLLPPYGRPVLAGFGESGSACGGWVALYEYVGAIGQIRERWADLDRSSRWWMMKSRELV